MALFEEWIDESYRAQAPKRLVRELDARDPAADKRAEPKKKVTKKAAKKKVMKKK
jgi:hypothetical protein